MIGFMYLMPFAFANFLASNSSSGGGMKFFLFILGLVIGVAVMIAKDKFMGNPAEQKMQSKQRELDSLYAENEKLHNRNKEMGRQVEDLLSENQKLKRQNSDRSDSHDDLEDALQDAKREIKKLRVQCEEAQREAREYKIACENYEAEINRLKNKD